jgi:glucose/arabinose dehydrogenase
MSFLIERLENRQLLSGDPLAYQNVVQTLPYVLNFQAAQHGVFDNTGAQTGFTLVQPNKNGTQYKQSLIHLNTAAKQLELTSQGTNTSGSNYGTDNTMVDGLETKFGATTAGFTITARLKGPLSQLNANYDAAGIFFGPDQDNYVKLVVGYNSFGGGQVLQFTDEQAANTHTVNTYKSIGSFSTIQTLDLRLTGNASTGSVTASYSVNGAAYMQVAGTVTLAGSEKANFFNSTGIAGITAISKNNLAPFTVPFGHFEIDAGKAVTVAHPSVRFTSPANNATNVSTNVPIEADLNLPNAAIDAQTIIGSNVFLHRVSDQTPIPAVVNTSGGGDSIILTPDAPLSPFTQYVFAVTAAVKDTAGVTMVPFQLTFTTGAASAPVDPTISFTQTALANTAGNKFTDLKIGPDGKLYASTEDGRIFRYGINADGTLGTPLILNQLQAANGGNRLITGFAFDPASTAANPILWISNSFYALSGATDGVDFTGKISVLSMIGGKWTVRDAVTNLPRSIADHSTEQPIFGPGPIAGHKYLYFAQASSNAFGAPDTTWGNRPEHLLTAAILRLDTSALNLSAGPINVRTPDAGGTYNPFATGAPLIIYATGVRNAFSLIFTANGNLLAVNNGSSAGGNTPGFSSSNPNQINGRRIDTGAPYKGPNVPALTNVQQTEDDYLYNIKQGGYYGHPNPTRGEYVLNDGHPSSGGVANEIVASYPLGTSPDPNYRGAVWDFGPHVSPDGIIEYQDKTFGGALQGALLVTEYSAGSDIVALKRDASGKVISETKGIAGLTNLGNPISLVENMANGNIYVAELGGQKIVLLKPKAVGK